MSRFTISLATAAAAVWALTALPAAAADCDTVAEGVQFCPGKSVWAGVPGAANERLGVTQYGRDQVLLLVGPAPDFAAQAWDGSAEGLSGVAESFASRAGSPVLERPALAGPDIAAASAVYQVNPELVSLITIESRAGGLVLVQTAEKGTALTDHQRRLHEAALAALMEDGQ